jgi:hypothetical protein
VKAWKIQKLFGDVVYDLRSRGLLPLAILLVVGILVAPILISRSSGSDSGSTAAAGPAQSAAELAPENQAAVLAYNPGLRNYKRRLDELASKDPFKQQFTAPAAAAAAAASGDAASGATGGGTTGGGANGGGGTGTSTSTSTVKYYYYETDVDVGEVGAKLQRRNRISPFSFLPSEQAPVLVFLGNLKQGKTASAAFLVSQDVTMVVGGGDCFPSPERCQMLVLKPGASSDLTYAVDGKTYRIKVVRVEQVVRNKPPQG